MGCCRSGRLLSLMLLPLLLLLLMMQLLTESIVLGLKLLMFLVELLGFCFGLGVTWESVDVIHANFHFAHLFLDVVDRDHALIVGPRPLILL